MEMEDGATVNHFNIMYSTSETCMLSHNCCNAPLSFPLSPSMCERKAVNATLKEGGWGVHATCVKCDLSLVSVKVFNKL